MGGQTLETQAVFVYGALRSGTTMFRLMLEAHPKISNPGETDFLFDHIVRDPTHATGWRYDREALETDRIFRAMRLVLPAGEDGLDLLATMLAQLDDGKVLTLNVHRHIDRLLEILPGARTLHLLRDPRDVARSSIAMGWSGTLYHGVNHWIRTEAAWDCVAARLAPGQAHELRYEALFRDIEGSLRQVCGFLGVPYDPAMLDYHKTSTYGPPDAGLVEQWRRLSTPGEIALVEGKAGALMRARGYAPTGPGRVPGPLEAARLGLANKVLVWRFGLHRFGPRLFLAEKAARWSGMSDWHRRVRLRMQEIATVHLK